MGNPVRSTMEPLVYEVRLMIGDPLGTNAFYQTDSDIQDRLDAYRDDIRYEQLTIAPSIVNTASTNNVAETIFADYYSKYQWWEGDVVLQGQDPTTHAFWSVLTPVASDLITGHWQFELTPFVNGTVPGQLPPVFITGKVYDLYLGSCRSLDVLGSESCRCLRHLCRRSVATSVTVDDCEADVGTALPQVSEAETRESSPERRSSTTEHAQDAITR